MVLVRLWNMDSKWPKKPMNVRSGKWQSFLNVCVIYQWMDSMWKRDGWTRPAKCARKRPEERQGKWISLGDMSMLLAWKNPLQGTSLQDSSLNKYYTIYYHRLQIFFSKFYIFLELFFGEDDKWFKGYIGCTQLWGLILHI